MAETKNNEHTNPGGISSRSGLLGETLVVQGAVSEAAVERALDLQQRKLGEILVDQGKVPGDTLQAALAAQEKLKALPGTDNSRKMDIRVDTEKLDKLSDLIDELITIESMVIDNPELAACNLDKFHLDAKNLYKITREMQEMTMAIRTIPLEGLFNKMHRLVRDLSNKSKKNIRLHFSGQDTEMDRNIIEEISGPLVHIIRNAVDHGIETKEVRKGKGKAPAGNINVSARYEGNEIRITVRDDGRGLHRDEILEKAKSSGICKPDGKNLEDVEVWDLIFEPGFSTVEQVSEISGRGVGMDVVRRNIEKLKGKIEVSSEPDGGTEFILRIPLTVAVIEGISARVGARMYSFPIRDIIGFHTVSKDQIAEALDGSPVLNLRGEIFPIIKLFEVFGIDAVKKEISDGVLILLSSGGNKAAVLVDEIIGNRQLAVKAMPEAMGEIKGISGCSVLSQGGVSLIIDANALMRRVVH